MLEALRGKAGSAGKKRAKVNSAIIHHACSLWEDQLCYYLRDPLTRFFREMYSEIERTILEEKSDESEDLKNPEIKRAKVLVKFQASLRSADKHERLPSLISSINAPLGDIFRIIAICKTMIMGSIRPENLADIPMPLEIHPLEKSMALVLRHVSNHLFFYPSSASVSEHDSERELFEKVQRLRGFIRQGIIDSLNGSLPIGRLVETYGLREKNYAATTEKSLEIPIVESPMKKKKKKKEKKKKIVFDLEAKEEEKGGKKAEDKKVEESDRKAETVPEVPKKEREKEKEKEKEEEEEEEEEVDEIEEDDNSIYSDDE